MSKLKKYEVDVEAKYCEYIIVKAKNKSEAKRKAIDKFRSKRSNFTAIAEVE